MIFYVRSHPSKKLKRVCCALTQLGARRCVSDLSADTVKIGSHASKRRSRLVALLIAAVVPAGAAQTLTPRAYAAPAPEVEYLYNVTARRHYNFPNNDALSYGHGICDKVSQGSPYAQVMRDVKTDVTPNDEFASNYLISYAVNLLCPADIWQLRNSAAHYQPSAG